MPFAQCLCLDRGVCITPVPLKADSPCAPSSLSSHINLLLGSGFAVWAGNDQVPRVEKSALQ